MGKDDDRMMPLLRQGYLVKQKIMHYGLFEQCLPGCLCSQGCHRGTLPTTANDVIFLENYLEHHNELPKWAIPQYPGHLHHEILIFSQKSLRTIHTYHLVPFKLPKNVQRGPFQGLLVFKNFFQKISNFTKCALTPTF